MLRAALVALGSVLLVVAGSAAEPSEPVSVDGAWIGTWWMGKYEEPIEMELVQRGEVISGRVSMSGYPGGAPAEHGSENAVIERGRLDGEQVTLTWRIGGRSLTATLAVIRPGALSGLGGEDGRVTAGFGLDRVR
jgi:hypothetical protein